MAYSKQTWVRGEKVASVKLNHMEDGIAAISANGAIDTTNIANGAVTLPKLADAVKSHFALADDVDELKNDLVNKYIPTMTQGYFINNTNGARVSNANYSASQFIDAELVDAIYTQCSSSPVGIAYYSEDLSFISGETSGSFNDVARLWKLTKPTGCKWVRFCNHSSVLPDSDVYCEINGFGSGLLDTKIGFNTDLTMTQSAITDAIAHEYKQLSFPNSGYIASTGMITPVAWAKTSDYIPVDFVNKIFTSIGNTASAIVAFYKEKSDAAANVVSVVMPTAKYIGWYDIVPPEGAKYLRFSVSNLNVGDYPSDITSYAKAVRLEPHANNEILIGYKSIAMTTGGYIRTYDGALMPATWCSYSDYIDLDTVTHIYTNMSDNIGLCYFTADHSYISGIDRDISGSATNPAEWYVLDPPANAKYVRFSNRNTFTDDSDVTIANVYDARIKWLQKSLNARINNIPSPTDFLTMYDKFICIGDSLTWSQVYTGDNSQRQAYKTYPSILGALSGGNGYLYATPGDSAVLWWSRSSQNAFANHGLFVVFLGTNGGFTDTISTDCVGTDPDEFNKTTNTGAYGAILQTIANNGDKAVLVKLWAGGGDSLAISNDVIEQFGAKYNFPVIDINTVDRATTEYHLYPDGTGSNGLHFNDLGYAWMANEIRNQINLLSASDKFKIMRAQ